MEQEKGTIAIQSRKIVKRALDDGYGLAIWRLPHSNEKHLIIDFDGSRNPESALEQLPSGVLFCPYQKNPKNNDRFIHADLHIQESQEGPEKIIIHPSKQYVADEFLQQVETQEEDNDKKPGWHVGQQGISRIEKSHFIQYVQKSIDAIRDKRFDKVVAARAKNRQLPQEFDVLNLFDNLSEKYPNAFVSVISLPETGTWIGATPEHLIGISPDLTFYTTALAGTQAYEPGMRLSDAAWKQKDIEEQAFVSRYIINCFKKIRLREFAESGPKTVKAGNLIHLKTDFYVNMNEVNFSQLGSVMLELLHPTSAICGMPKEAASQFIDEEESLDRKYFSGYLGPVNMQEDTQLFVNLRCMELHRNEATFFAGAGITIDSDPEMEWQETEMKMKSLLNCIET
jgi:isochorismate synthase